MNTKEAIERIKTRFDKWALDDEDMKAIQTLIPELKESEDEKIRKYLLGMFPDPNDSWDGISAMDIIAYLERQKEQKPMQFKGENVIEIIKGEFEGFRSLLKKKGIDYEPQSTYWESLARLFDSSAREYLKEKQSSEWKPLPESMEALLFAIEGKWEMIKPTSYLSRRLEDLYEGLVNTYNVDETFLAELPKTDYTAKDIEEPKALKRKIDASMDEKLAGWSEEDERMLGKCIDAASGYYDPKDKQMMKDWLTSLRPSWKPSEEQINALNSAIVFKEIRKASDDDITPLKSLYNDLKKL